MATPFGRTGGARGVDEVGDVIGRRRRQCGAGLAAHRGIVDINDRRSHPSSRDRRPGVVIDRDRRGVSDHELDPGRRQRRVDRQIRRPGLEHRQHRHDRLRGTLQQQRHTRPGPHRWAANRCANRFDASSSSR